MTNKEKKAFLRNYSTVEMRINTLKKELTLSPECASSIEQELEELIAIKNNVLIAIQKLLDIRERQVITLAHIGAKQGDRRYCLKLKQIADEMGYSLDSVELFHINALKHLEI